MKVWVTKYALTKGVQEITAAKMDGESCWNRGYGNHFFGQGKEWHRTKESAIAEANDMRDRKIASLKRQIAKLEKLTFD